MNNNDQGKKNKSPALRIVYAAICVALIAVIVLTALNFDAIKRALGFSSGPGSRTDVFYYSANKGNTFAAVEGGLAVASSSGVQYFNSEGEKVVSQQAQMAAPALDTENGLSAAFDIGGNKLCVFTAASVLLSEELDEKIIDVSVGEGGCFAVTTQEGGYKGSVTIYDKQLEPSFKWFSGSGNVLCASVSPDNLRLAVCSVTDSGGRVVFLDVGSEEEGPDFKTDGTIILETDFVSDNVLAAIAEDAVYFLGTDGSFISSYDYSGSYLRAFSTDAEGYTALYLTEGRAGASGKLVTLDQNGGLIAETPAENVVNISCAGRYLGVLCDNRLIIYDSGLSEYASTGGVSGASSVLMRGDGTAILVSSYSASLYIP